MLAILFGTLVIASAKGTPVHRWLGRGYLVMMLALNASALAIYELFGRFGPFHWRALASRLTRSVGYLPTWRKSPGWMTRHAFYMAGSYVGLLAALASEIVTRVPGLMFFSAVLVTSAIVIVAGIWIMLRYIPPILRKMR